MMNITYYDELMSDFLNAISFLGGICALVDIRKMYLFNAING